MPSICEEREFLEKDSASEEILIFDVAGKGWGGRRACCGDRRGNRLRRWLDLCGADRVRSCGSGRDRLGLAGDRRSGLRGPEVGLGCSSNQRIRATPRVEASLKRKRSIASGTRPPPEPLRTSEGVIEIRRIVQWPSRGVHPRGVAAQPGSLCRQSRGFYLRENPLREERSRGPPLIMPANSISRLSFSGVRVASMDWRTSRPIGRPVRRAFFRSSSSSSSGRRMVSVLLIRQHCNTFLKWAAGAGLCWLFVDVVNSFRVKPAKIGPSPYKEGF